jgi:hypothetical protein
MLGRRTPSLPVQCVSVPRPGRRPLPSLKRGAGRERAARTRVGLADNRAPWVAGARSPTRDPQRRAIDMRPNQRPRLLFRANLLRFRAFWAHSRTKADARDWLEKTEDWQMKTGRGGQSLLSGDNTFIEDAVGLCRTEAEVAL